MRSRARNDTLPADLLFNCVRMRVRKISLLIGNRVSFFTGSSTTHGTPCAFAICGIPKMLRDILSVTDTTSCDSTPVPATKPCSSAFMTVTGVPEGFFTPDEAQPAIKLAAKITKADFECCLINVRFIIKGGIYRGLLAEI